MLLSTIGVDWVWAESVGSFSELPQLGQKGIVSSTSLPHLGQDDIRYLFLP